MKKLSIPSLIFLSSFTGFSQALYTSYLTSRYTLDRLSTVGAGINSVLPGLPMPPPELVGDPFLTRTYNTGAFLLYDSQVFTGVPGKLDLLRNEFYFLTGRGPRIFQGHLVKSFMYQDSLTKRTSTFISAREFKNLDGASLAGFYEIIHDAPFALLKKTEALEIKSNYNPALDVGRRDNTIKKTTKYYYLIDGATGEIPKKSTTKIFGDKKSDIDAYIKSNELNIKDESHLKLIFEYYNQIVKS